MSLGKVLWKAIDGKEFVIDTKKLGIETVEQLQSHITVLRKQHGYEQPDFGGKNDIMTHAITFNSKVQKKFEKYSGTIESENLPENLRDSVVERAIEALKKPDPKKLD